MAGGEIRNHCMAGRVETSAGPRASVRGPKARYPRRVFSKRFSAVGGWVGARS